MAAPLLTKAAARYRGDGGVEHCSLCRFFSPVRGGRCARVLGDISPRGWCRLFSREMRAMIADVPFVAGGGGPAPTLSLDFMTPGVLSPLLTFTRASTGTYIDSAGIMQTAAIDAPRWDYDPATLALRGLLLEDQRTNGIRNTTMTGTVIGTPGTLPTNWSIGLGATALTSQIVSVGTEGGIAYFDLRLSGTAGATGGVTLVPENATTIAAANGQTWIASLYFRLVGGTVNGMTVPSIYIRESTSGGGLVRDNIITVAQVTNAALATQRVTTGGVTLIGGGTVAMVQPRFNFNVTSGAAIDVTIRIGAPQMEQGDFATSYIPTSAVAVTRNIDSCLIPPANMAPWFVSPGGSWFAEFRYFDVTPLNIRIVSRTASGSLAVVFINASGNAGQYDGVSMFTANALAANTISKVCSTWTAGQAKVCANGGTVAKSAALVTGYGIFATTGVPLLTPAGPGNSDNTSGHIRAVRYWPTVLADADMQAMTA